MRKAFDGLLALAVDHLGHDPRSGGLFVFLNRRRDRMKLLYRDVDGLAVWAKRLEAGSRFDDHSPYYRQTVRSGRGGPRRGPRRASGFAPRTFRATVGIAEDLA